MDNSVVLGWGTVGKATAEAFGITKYYSRSSQNVSLEEAARCRYIFVCLPTPVRDDKYQTGDIEQIVNKVASTDNIIIIRSTVYPGFCDKLNGNIVFNPEFLNEETAVEDAKNPQLIVIGANNPDLGNEVKALYEGRFKYKEPLVTDLRTAELIKLGLNGFFTTKVVFANQMYDYAQRVGANYEVFKRVIESHPWGTKNHFTVFHKGGRGAGGKCLFKDIQALAHYSDKPLFRFIHIINKLLLETTNKT